MHARRENARNLILHRKLRNCVDDVISSNQNIPDELQIVFDKSQSIVFRILWIFLCVLCFALCCYQTYDRVQYYLSKPIAVNIDIRENKFINLPTIYLNNIDTDDLKPYLIHESDLFACSNCIRALFKKSKVARQNVMKLWNASNATSNLQKIFVEYKGKILSFVDFKNRTVVDSLNIKDYDWKEKYSLNGLATAVSTTVPVNIGAKLNIVVRKAGNCGMQAPEIWLDNVVPFHYYSTYRFHAKVQISISVKQFHMLNREGNQCEGGAQLLKQCYHNCLVKKYLNMSCWLPYMPIEAYTRNCSLLQDGEIQDIYDDARRTFVATSPTFDCLCTKPCVRETLQFRGKLSSIDSDNLVIQYYSKDPFVVSFHELYAYQLVNLLIDIGGNMGLYLGWSVLSIIQYGQFVILGFDGVFKLTRTMKQQSKQINNKLRHKVQLLVNATHTDKNQATASLFSRGIKLIVFILSCSVSIYVTTDRVLLYLNIPTRSIVDVTEYNVVPHPNMIFCGENAKIAMFKKTMAKKKHLGKCDINFLDLLDGRNISVEELWKITTTEHFSKVTEIVLKIIGINTQMNQSSTEMYNGRCAEFAFVPQAFVGAMSSYYFSFQAYANPNANNCTHGLMEFFIKRQPHSRIYSTFPSKRHFSTLFVVSIFIRTLKITRFNTTNMPCIRETEFEDCSNNCYDNKMQRAVNCRLPYMENINKTWCTNTAEAKEAQKTFLAIASKTNVQEECNCNQPCNETIYQPLVYFYEPDTPSPIQTTCPLSNLIENIIEVPSYNLVTMLCDIANCFGLMLGLSLLAGLKNAHNVVNYFYFCIKK